TVGKSVSDGTTDSVSRSMGTAQGLTGGMSQGTSATTGIGPSMSYSKSFQWIDQEVANIVKLLEFQNNRIMTALNGGGAFYTDVYIATMDEEGKKTAQSLAKSAWYGDTNLVCPVQVMDLTPDEEEHLLYHFNAFSADASKEGIPCEIESYKYSTILLPMELTAYSHLPRISEGGLFADVNDIPKFAVPSMRKGEIYMGKVLSAERWTARWGYQTPFDFRLANDEIMHGFFTGESRSGKTVAATRFIAEIAHKVRRDTGKRLRIVCMDPKQDWRILAHFVEPERFHFYSLGNPEFLPINLNVCKIPHNVFPQQWIDGLIELFCRAYGLGERGKSVLAETFYELYNNAGVFCEEWREVAPERSRVVTFPAIFKRMSDIKLSLEDPTSKKGKVGNDVRDAYSRVLDRLQVFGRSFSIESRLFGRADGMGIDELIGADDVVVLESYGLESTFKNFVFGTITSGFFKWAQGHEGGFKSKDQYETILVIEEANEVLVGQDSADKSGGSPLSGQSEFEKILDQSAGLGLFIISITQKIAAMPSSVIANSGLVFAGKISREEDVKIVIRKIGREERYEDRDLAKWFPRSPIGWFVCRSGRNFDFKEMEPVLVSVSKFSCEPPSNCDLEYIIAKKAAKKAQAK
ncbi:MAG TPA: serine-rich protein, partial [Anaerovoracaceae bacterium]|nr:serine-rich protein [Anaerovoracaceae bacterium]